jgi:PQQ enzyme-like repeat protein
MRIRAVAGWALVATLCMFAGACNRNAIDPNLPAITTQPSDVTVAAGGTATFTVVATGQAPLSYQWFVFAKAIKGATSASYTTAVLAPSDNNSFYFCLVTNSLGSIESDEALLTVTTPAKSGVTANTLGNANPADALTMHNDGARTGQYLGESFLTPSTVNAAKFGKLGTLITDGQVDVQPLYASGVTLPSGDVRNILYVASEHGSVYAFDAATGSVIWQAGLVGTNEQPADSGTCTSAPQERGITATPVIDRTRGPHGAIYAIANTKDTAGTVVQRIHALDVATGAELFNGPTLIQESADPANAAVATVQQNFNASSYQALAGLQLANGKVFAAWGPTCGTATDSGWVIGFDAASLNPAGAVYLAPASAAGSPAMVVSGITADSTGSLYIFGSATVPSYAQNSVGTPTAVSSGDAFLRLSTVNELALANYSRADGTASTSSSGSLIGPSAVMSDLAVVLPDLNDNSGKTWHLALGPANDGNVYVVNRDSLVGAAAQSPPVVQEIGGASITKQMTTAVAYFDNTVYYAASGHSFAAYAINDARVSSLPTSQSANSLGARGAQMSISANGANSGILWAIEDNGTAILHAYDAANLSQEIYNSTRAANARDAFASIVISVSPTVAGGRVYIATQNGIVVFGQLK